MQVMYEGKVHDVVTVDDGGFGYGIRAPGSSVVKWVMKDAVKEVDEKNIHEVSERMLVDIKRVAYEQDEYGFQKYNTPLNAFDPYDWYEMFLQEQADGMKYVRCFKDRVDEAVKFLHEQKSSNSASKESIISYVLFLLTSSGKEVKG